MKKSKFSKTQIVSILKQADAGVSVKKAMAEEIANFSNRVALDS